MLASFLNDVQQAIYRMSNDKFRSFFSKSAKYMVREILGIDSTGTIFYCSSSFPCPSKNKNKKTCVQMRYVVYK